MNPRLNIFFLAIKDLRRRVIRILLLLISLLASGCSSGVPNIQVHGAEAAFSPVMRGMVSVFMEIRNTGNGSDTLTGAKTDFPDSIVELHDEKDGRMAKQKKFSVPAGKGLFMRPGGPHIMIFRMPLNMHEGDEFTLYLLFEKSGRMPITVRITKPTAIHSL
jgi:hypothetical protein